jgi:homoserine O-succinyltransferase/O-acetyltransferase
MPLLIDTARSGSAVDLRGRNCLTIGLVNNMPDAACEATERQFLDLIRATTNDVVVRLKLYSIPEVPRADAARRRHAARYRDMAELRETQLDGLIVTGTEPRAAKLEDEPYWAALTGLVDWARDNTVSTIWSCLAAHAAVLHDDGVERIPLEQKVSGVFSCEQLTAHPLLAGVGPRFRVPHSRINDLPEAALVAGGYRSLSRSDAVGIDAFVREDRGSSLFVYFQGHPEYEADSLLREYRRDVGRFLRRERDRYPEAPRGYFNNTSTFLANDFRMRAVGERRGDLVGDFPMAALEAGVENSWRGAATRIYRNWIDYLKDGKAERRTPAAPEQKSGRDARRMSAG